MLIKLAISSVVVSSKRSTEEQILRIGYRCFTSWFIPQQFHLKYFVNLKASRLKYDLLSLGYKISPEDTPFDLLSNLPNTK